MRAINHAIAGAVIGLSISQPAIAVPIAFVSHYIMDAIPHFDLGLGGNKWLDKKSFKYILLFDALLCFGLVLTLGVLQPANWLMAIICAFVATAPDFASIPRYITVNSGKQWCARGYMKFASGIQWFERPIGVVVEFVWFVAGIVVLSVFLNT